MSQPMHRVWFVDDEPDERFLMEHALRGLRERVQLRFFECARALQEALESATAHETPHLIVSDLKMPQMDGIQLLTWLRESRWSRLPFLILSNSCSEKDMARARTAGADDYLVKAPATSEMTKQLTEAVDSWLHKGTVP